MIAIEKFRACITTVVSGRPQFDFCRVVGITDAGKFVAIVETEEGKLLVRVAEELDVIGGQSPVSMGH